MMRKTSGRLARADGKAPVGRSARKKAQTSNALSTHILTLLILPFGLLLIYFIHSHPAFAPTKALTNQSATSVDSTLDEATRKARQTANASRIAVCFVGHVGTLTRVHRQNLVAFGKLSSVPVTPFFVLDLQDDFRDDRTGIHYSKHHEIGSLQPIFDSMNAAAVDTLSLPELLADGKRRHSSSSCMTDATSPSSSSHDADGTAGDGIPFTMAYAPWTAARKCFDLVRREETNTGMQFDWVVQLRPDMHIAVRLPPVSAPPRVHLSGLAMALVPRQLCDKFFAVVDAFSSEGCQQVLAVKDDVCVKYAYGSASAECLLVKWLHLHDIVPSNGVYVNRRIVYSGPA